MTAPRYREKAKPRHVVEAVQFVLADPTTHWHVNLGHPIIALLQNKYWVPTAEGAQEIEDGQFVVLDPDKAKGNSKLTIMPAADFLGQYELMIEDKA